MKPSLIIYTYKKAELTRYTGGSIFWYPAFSSRVSGDKNKLARDLSNYLVKNIMIEAVIKVRMSSGYRIEEVYGNSFVKSSNVFFIPFVNYELSHTFTITVEDAVSYPIACFQISNLYTTLNGDRHIRVITLALPVVKSVAQLNEFVDQQAMAHLITKAGE